MGNTRVLQGLLASCLVGLCLAETANAAPTVAQMLAFEPSNKEITSNLFSTPAADEHPGCKVELVQGTKAGSSGWILLDTKQRPVRKFFDSNGDKQIDVWSYFKDGMEVYREIDSNFNGKADQFRWLGPAGIKWGVSSKEDKKIDSWRMISAEEAGQEAFQALVTGDYPRFEALLITENEIQALGLTGKEADKIKANVKNASTAFADVRTKNPQFAKSTFVRVEAGLPGAYPGESVGAPQDIIKSVRTILFETPDKKHDFLQTHDMIQVGLIWRLTNVPSADNGGVTGNPKDDYGPNYHKLLAQLGDHDKNPPVALISNKADPAVVAFYDKRVGLIEQIIPEIPGSKAPERENWIKQIFDNLSGAHLAGGTTHMKRLNQYRQQVVLADAKSNLSAYATYRELWATYAGDIAAGKKQEEWQGKLADYVKAYPKSEDAPDALSQLAMGSEFNGKEEESSRWYKLLYSTFPEHPLAEKAKGAERRLKLVNNPLELEGPSLINEAPFNITQTKGKVVLVYYWASYCNVCAGDFGRIKQAISQNPKDVELVTINLDNDKATAMKYLENTPVQGTHLFKTAKDQTGLNSPLATFYGINGLPTLFLVGRDGRVISRSVNINDLENEVKKGL